MPQKMQNTIEFFTKMKKQVKSVGRNLEKHTFLEDKLFGKLESIRLADAHPEFNVSAPLPATVFNLRVIVLYDYHVTFWNCPYLSNTHAYAQL